MRDPAVDVVILSWNGREDTLRALASVVDQIGTGPDQVDKAIVTVVDNGSSDGTEDAIRIRFPGVRILRLEENRGFTGGIMHAVSNSWAPYALFLNNDAVAEPGWLHASVEAIRNSDEDVIAISGRITDSTGELADFVGGVMTFDGHGFQPGFRRDLRTVDEPDHLAEIFFACGGNMIVRRRPFIELGGFDDDFFAYLEDVDFGWRAWLSGWRILYNRHAVARHKSSATSDRLGAFERGVLFERNAVQTILKNVDDELLAEFSGPLFLTLLHRLQRYVIDRNESTDELRRPPLEKPAPGRTSLARRIARKLTGRREAPTVTDPLAIMQFRAIEWVLRNETRIVEKRRDVQAGRTRGDRDIFERFPLFVVPTYPGDEELMSSALFRLLMPRVPTTEKTLAEIMST